MAVGSFKCASTLVAHRGVAIETGTAWTVSYPAAVTEIPIGITLDDSHGPASADQAVPVALTGEIAKLYIETTMHVGNPVEIDSSGRGLPASVPSTGGYAIGVLVSPVVPASGTGTLGEVLIMPMWIETP